MTASAVPRISSRNLLLLFVGGIALGGIIQLKWGQFIHWSEPSPGRVDVGEKSSDLPADRRLMWETQKLGGTPDPTHGPNPRASTDRAINAASRVFNTVELVGKTRAEAIAILGDPQASNDSTYNFPFWTAPTGSLIYRFDSGAYGWQFNLAPGADGRIRKVERRWIH